jgi:hypothetical protein
MAAIAALVSAYLAQMIFVGLVPSREELGLVVHSGSRATPRAVPPAPRWGDATTSTHTSRGRAARCGTAE